MGHVVRACRSWRAILLFVVIGLFGTAAQVLWSQESNSANRAPTRVIHDSYPTYSAVAMDHESNVILLQDENLFGIKEFDRLTNTPPSARFS